MNKAELLKKMLPGLLPLFVFILADEIFGTKIGLVVAIVFGVLQLVFFYLKQKRVDKFILFDTLLIVAMGGVSILLENDLFFMLKPAIINLIMCVILGISAFSSKNLVAKMTANYMRDFKMNNEQLKQLKNSSRILFFLFIIHSFLVVYSAYYMTKEAWAFISGGLFYLLFGVYFIFELLRKRFQFLSLKKQEWLPIVDEEGKIKGKALRVECHKNKELLHPVIHLHIINEKNEIYLQKRPRWKTVQANKWDTAVGGHVSYGENIETTLKREAEEELGIKGFKAQFISKYLWESDIEKEVVFTYICLYQEHIVFNKKEVADGRFWTIKEIQKNLRQNIFTPNFEKEFPLVLNLLLKK